MLNNLIIFIYKNMYKDRETYRAYHRVYYHTKRKKVDEEKEKRKEYMKEWKRQHNEYMKQYMREYKEKGPGSKKRKQEERLQECYQERLSGSTELLELEIVWLEMTGTTSENNEKHKAYNAWKYRSNKEKGITYKRIDNKELYRAQKEKMPVYDKRFLPYIKKLMEEE